MANCNEILDLSEKNISISKSDSDDCDWSDCDEVLLENAEQVLDQISSKSSKAKSKKFKSEKVSKTRRCSQKKQF